MKYKEGFSAHTNKQSRKRNINIFFLHFVHTHMFRLNIFFMGVNKNLLEKCFSKKINKILISARFLNYDFVSFSECESFGVVFQLGSGTNFKRAFATKLRSSKSFFRLHLLIDAVN